jgi:ribosomal protein S27AE
VVYLFICAFFGLAGGFVGKVKGSSFWIWFLISAILPGIGLFAAFLYRVDRDELRRQCPSCGRVVKLHDALCTRCGAELEFPETAIVPESQARSAAR